MVCLHVCVYVCVCVCVHNLFWVCPTLTHKHLLACVKHYVAIHSKCAIDLYLQYENYTNTSPTVQHCTIKTIRTTKLIIFTLFM